MLTPTSKILNVVGFRPTGDLGPLTGYTSKRGKAVWFLKAPPKTPPTGWQRIQRNRFRLIAMLWAQLTPHRQDRWKIAAIKSRLNITGYNLFVWYQYTLDGLVIGTVERQSGITLLPVYPPP